MARPAVRVHEMMILTFEEVDSAYLKEFWRCVSEMTDCSIFAIQFPEEKRNITGSKILKDSLELIRKKKGHEQ